VTHHFDERKNVLYDLVRGIVVKLSLRQVVKEDPLETREYSIAELHAGVRKKLTDVDKSKDIKENDTEKAEEEAENDPDLVLVSFYGFLAAPGIAGAVMNFHANWLQGYYVAKLMKNRNIVATCTRGKMTDEDRQFAEEKIRDQGFEPYDPRKHGPA
jgi:hypothetical protein